MRKLIYPILCMFLLFFTLCVKGQNANIKKSSKAMFSLNTFRADGSLVDTSYGVFIGTEGEAIAPWKPFVGASRAVVIDVNGTKYDVEGLIGANSLYDVCKFKVIGKTPSAPVFSETSTESLKLYYGVYKVKTPELIPVDIEKVENFYNTTDVASSKKYSFYILRGDISKTKPGAPVFNSLGEVVGISQLVQSSETMNVVSALYPSQMEFQQLGNSMTTLSLSNIPSVLPGDYKDAQLALMLASQQRKGDSYLSFIDYFIRKFPTKADGYESRARFYASAGKYALAASDMEKAIELAEDKASIHYSYSNMILQELLYQKSDSMEQWNIDKALSEIEEAYRIDSNAIYLEHKAKVLYAKSDFSSAYDIYMQLQSTRLSGPEIMFAATQCQQALGSDLSVIIEHIDSTIAVCPKPMTYQSAPYVFERGLIYQRAGEYRKAIIDYNEYERLMVGNQLPSDFYYNRFICEREGRLYKQALDDINKAITLNSYEPLYLCEKASLELRLKMTDEAIATANKALIVNASYPDAYAILGTAQCIKGNKHEGLLNIERSKDLGYPNADALIKKYR